MNMKRYALDWMLEGLAPMDSKDEWRGRRRPLNIGRLARLAVFFLTW